MDLQRLKAEFENCPCGKKHGLNIKAVETGSGITRDTGRILERGGFKKRLLLVADENTLAASNGIKESLERFDVRYKVYKNLRAAELKEALHIAELLKDADAVLSVGTGSLNDICRYGAAQSGKPLAIFATAASMDGFASDTSPLTDGCFKSSYPAKMPEIIIADTKILANAPPVLKSAGFGDMAGKYTALIDWQVSHLISGEYYCEKTAALTRRAVDGIFALQNVITSNDEKAANAVFEALLLTGIGMSFTGNSRPASGTEHILSHFWECKKLLDNKQSDYHGNKVGVATLIVMREYEKLLSLTPVRCHKDDTDFNAVFAAYGSLRAEVEKMNFPESITAPVNPDAIRDNWQKIKQIIRSVPSYKEIESSMKTAGCPLTYTEIDVTPDLYEQGVKYHPYMRRRLSLLRLLPMVDFDDPLRE